MKVPLHPAGTQGMSEGAGNPALLRVLLVDDEPLALERLRLLLDRIGGAVVVAEAATGAAALEAIEKLAPDVVLLDINLPDLSGLRLLEALDDPPAVIFCTAYAEHAMHAYDLEAADYLLKPFSAERLGRALERTRRLLAPATGGDHAGPEQGDESARSAEAPAPASRISALDGPATVLVPVERIVCFRVEVGVTFLFRDDGESLICCDPIRTLEMVLPERSFFRANRQAIISLDAVLSFEPAPEGGYRVQLRSGIVEHVSRRRARFFRTRIRGQRV